MTVYVSYSYYTDNFLGTLVASGDFDALELRASRHIDRLTYNRVADIVEADEDEDEVDAIKDAVCAVVDELYNQSQADSDKAIKSESVGGHSLSYVDNPDLKRTQLDKIRQAARLWLESTYLLFPGFYTGEYGGSGMDNLSD